MKRERIELYTKNQYKYPLGDFLPNLECYLQDDDKALHSALLICPGGGYSALAPHEAYWPAIEYFKAGYNVYVLSYSINLLGLNEPLKMQPILDVSRAVCEIRKRAKNDKTNDTQIALMGFSAGGHLVGSYAVHYDFQGVKAENDKEVDNRPNAIILAYPVISAMENTHAPSIVSLLGNCPTNDELEFMSIEKHIKTTTPPMFLWHTKEDETVPYINSVNAEKSCKEKGVYAELHLYNKGNHGLGVANESSLKGEIGDAEYMYKAVFENIKLLSKSKIKGVPKHFKLARFISFNRLVKSCKKGRLKNKTVQIFDKEISGWIKLSQEFLQKVWSM